VTVDRTSPEKLREQLLAAGADAFASVTPAAPMTPPAPFAPHPPTPPAPPSPPPAPFPPPPFAPIKYNPNLPEAEFSAPAPDASWKAAPYGGWGRRA
jgi:hypothetical protein